MPAPRKIRCAVARIADHGGHVYTVELKPETQVPAFRPGQFLHFALDEYVPSGFWPESRVFSVASNPTERDRLLICYSVNGVFTKRMEQEMQVGSEVWVKLPYGDFVIEAHPEVVLMAGGTGISAFSAFIGELSGNRGGRVHLYYGVRNPTLLLFQEEFDAVLGQAPCFHATYCLEHGTVESVKPFSGRVKVRSGILSADFPVEDGFRASGTIFYLSGPPAMLKVLSNALLTLGAAPERIRVDAWE